MVDYYKYCNEFVFTLPEEKQQQILDALNRLHRKAWSYFDHEHRLENEDAKAYCRKYYTKYMNQLDVIIRFLNDIDIYPAFGWIGHDEYFFPTEADCDLEEERYWKCLD